MALLCRYPDTLSRFERSTERGYRVLDRIRCLQKLY